MSDVNLSSHDASPGKTRPGAAPWWRRAWTFREIIAEMRARPRAVGAICVYLICAVAMKFPFSSITRVFGPQENPAIAEAFAWREGRLDLPERQHDTAVYRGRVYSVHAPLYAVLTSAVLPFCPEGMPRYILILVLALPAPGLAYLLFLRRVSGVFTAVVLTVGLVCGTSYAPVLVASLRNGNVYTVLHALSFLALLGFLMEVYGRRRLWVLGLCFALTLCSRQLTVFYAIAMLWAAWNGPGNRGRRLAWVAVAGAAAAIPPMILNVLKFDHPLEFGYRHMYVDREDGMARAATHGLFSPRFIPRNLYYMNLGFPVIRTYPRFSRLEANYECTGIWWTSPILFLFLAYARSIWRRSENRAVLIPAAIAFLALTLYHGAGGAQYGYNRYSLDYLPAVFTALAPCCEGGWRTWAAVGCVLWSTVYFCRLIAV